MVGMEAQLGEALWIFIENFHWVVVGVVVGMVLGTIPGMGGVVVLTLLLPFTLSMEPFQAFALLSGALGATTFSGSLTAILINTPGTSSNAATLIDGYPMTQKGESIKAISASAIASASGAVVAIIIFILAIPLLMQLVLAFGPAQIFWVIISALVIIPLVVGERAIAGIIVGAIGLLVSFIGQAPQTAETRMVFGTPELFDGVEILAPLIGLFAIAEIVRLASLQRKSVVPDSVEITGKRVDGAKEVIKHKWLWLRCSIIGLVIGAVPGAGGASSSFIAYGHAVQSAADPRGFGEGRIEGVIASEAANDAKDGGQLFPSLGLGIPGSGSMAVFLAGLLAQGILPGPQLLIEETTLVMVIAYSVLASNILTSVIGLTFVHYSKYFLRIPLDRLLPAIAVFALSAMLVVRNNTFDVWMAVLFAIFGVILIYLNISRIPFIIAFILGSILEQNYYLAVAYQSGDVTAAFFSGTANHILILIFIFTIFSLLLPMDTVKSRLYGALRRVVS